MISEKLIAAIKLSPMPAYKIAWSAGINPTMLSKLVNGIERPKPNDRRIISVGKILGLRADECFKNESKKRGLILEKANEIATKC
jgi:hypothetical protein